jgi:Ni/Fe-hydrogenase subunit HybB-like protein
MTLRQMLMFDVNRILKWDVGRALKADVFSWRIPALLLWAALGWLVAGVLLAITVPFAVRRGWELPEWAPLLIIIACVTAFVLLGRRSRRG